MVYLFHDINLQFKGISILYYYGVYLINKRQNLAYNLVNKQISNVKTDDVQEVYHNIEFPEGWDEQDILSIFEK